MGCPQSTSAVRPVEVYDTHTLGATGTTDNTTTADSGIVLDVVQLTKPIKEKPKEVKECRIVKAASEERPKTAQSNRSESSVDSGMGSSDTSLMFKNITRQTGLSIDTSLAKSNIQVVSMCSNKLDIDEYPEGRNDGKPCSIYWHSQVHNDMKNYIKSPEARVNKFPGMTELARKISLTHAIRSMRQLFPSEYEFYPNSWILPSQFQSFQNYSTKNPKKWFIVKPDEGSQAVGIYLVNNVDQLHNRTDKLLIQEYLDEPYLLADRLKFDFRVYAVIKSLNPLSIHIAREGMARFCTEKYQKPTSGNIENLYSHLTNYSLNKSNNSYVHSRNLKDQWKGSKRLLSTVFHQMESSGVKTRKLWHDIKLIIIKTVLAMVPEVMLNYEHYFSDAAGPQCFQIMGFDVIVDKNGIPYLLEVNSAPSLAIEHLIPSNELPVRSIVDEIIKVPLVRDTILLVLNQLYDSDKTSVSNDSVNNNTNDDITMEKRRNKPHLSEIFPARYGSNSKHLLILDRAVYLFMQVVNIKQNLTITFLSMRAFIKKCSLTDVISMAELEKMYCPINYYFTGKDDDLKTGLPFHGFLQLLFKIAWIKFSFCEDQLSALQRLFAYCDSSLRHYGVRSTRLRRTEVETDMNANSVDIYLLPNRIRKAKPTPSSYQQNQIKKRTRSMQRSEPHTDVFR